jgi:hypothetical protein
MDAIARLSRGFAICESSRRAIHGSRVARERDPPVRGNARLAKARPRPKHERRFDSLRPPARPPAPPSAVSSAGGISAR